MSEVTTLAERILNTSAQEIREESVKEVKPEETIEITIKQGKNKYNLAIPDETDIPKLLTEVGADSARTIRDYMIFRTMEDGTQVAIPDPIIGAWHRTGRLSDGYTYELFSPNKEKLKKYIETYS